MQSFQNDRDRRSSWISSWRRSQVLEASEFFTNLMVAYVEPLSEATCLRETAPVKAGNAATGLCSSLLVVYGSTVTSTNAGKLSAPLLSVTRNLNRYVRGSETAGARKEASELLVSSSETLLPRTWSQL